MNPSARIELEGKQIELPIMDERKTRIYRPRQVYTGPTLSPYVPSEERG
jgi:hypothetical protein